MRSVGLNTRGDLDFIKLRKPTQNSLIEHFNRTFRQDVLDSYQFDTLPQMRKYVQAWVWMYNNERLYSALERLTPMVQQGKNKKVNWN
ncbi:MAG: transposase [Spirosomataceae bacterium]